MANFAKINGDLVTEVIVVSNDDCDNLPFPESEPVGQAYIASLGIEGEWLQTSYTGAYRGLFAGIGYTWDGTGFAPPQPFASWTKNAETYLWEAPTPMPTTGMYKWDEPTLSWVEVTQGV